LLANIRDIRLYCRPIHQLDPVAHSDISAKKIVLQCPDGYQPQLDALVEQWIRRGVVFVGVVGRDCEKVHDIIDELCVGDGSHPYSMLTSWHTGETVEDVVEQSYGLSGHHAGPVEVVELGSNQSLERTAEPGA
jgi:hypothetical protein